MNLLKTATMTVRYGGMRNRVRRDKTTAGLALAVVGLLSMPSLIKSPTTRAFAQAAAPSWSFTGSPNESRGIHTATLLPDGKVLVVGVLSAELYDPSTGTWSVTGSPNVPRAEGYSATLLANGKVLVAGVGSHGSSDLISTAELYNPATGEWSFTGNPRVFRSYHTATLLANGKVLFAGGGILRIIGGGLSIGATNTAELYDPATGEWSLTGDLSVTRFGHAATLLQDGKVLVAGGCEDNECLFYLGNAEVYDPDTGTWSITGSVKTPRENHTLTTLPDGNVLMSGGQGRPFPFTLNAAELYNPATGQWSLTGNLRKRRWGETVTLLRSGKVLVAGGAFSYDSAKPGHTEVFNSAEVFDPATGRWKTIANMNRARSAHTATLLADGRVLVVGGSDRSAELYDPEVKDPAPRIILASVSGKKLIISGENFDDGAAILINGEEQRTRNDAQNPQTMLIGKKAGKKIKTGDQIQVRNPDGTFSEAFIFTGS